MGDYLDYTLGDYMLGFLAILGGMDPFVITLTPMDSLRIILLCA